MFSFNKNRLTTSNKANDANGPVAYWMSREQRNADNWALLWAQDLARQRGAPLAVVFCLVPEFLQASFRQYAFMLQGLQETQENLAAKNIPFYLLTGRPEDVLPPWQRQNNIQAIVADFDPLRIKRAWRENVVAKVKIPFYEVDAHNIVPCLIVSAKQEYGAYTLRPKMHRMLEEYLEEFPPLRRQSLPWKAKKPQIDWVKLKQTLAADRSVGEVSWIKSGEKAAQAALSDFIVQKLPHYVQRRNDPNQGGQSNLSPYLHFGQLSAQRVALEVRKAAADQETKNAFLEELIIRRELADNFCLYNPDYDNFAGFSAWAQKTLNEHRGDPRPYLYSREQLEQAQTHDDLWNAAQMEMVKRGKMHGYLRMYWAKKILEWMPAPEEAMAAAIYLNDKYELDGRDPNGYAGIAWSIGGVHDRAWNERNVFGKIRYMSYKGCQAKFNIKKYVEWVGSL